MDRSVSIGLLLHVVAQRIPRTTAPSLWMKLMCQQTTPTESLRIILLTSGRLTTVKMLTWPVLGTVSSFQHIATYITRRFLSFLLILICCINTENILIQHQTDCDRTSASQQLQLKLMATLHETLFSCNVWNQPHDLITMA